MFRFVDKVNHDSPRITPEDMQPLYAAGWDDDAIYFAITVCALFNFYNRWIDASGVHALSDEAHRAGRKTDCHRTGIPAINRPVGDPVVASPSLHFGVMVSFGSLLVFTFGIFLKPLTAEFGWSREAVSVAFGFAAMTVAVCSPVLGVLLDRFGPRKVILPCMTVFGLAFASLGLLTPNLGHLYAMFVVLGMVGNGTTQMGYSRAVSTWFDGRRGMALALVMAGVGTGAMVFPPLAQALIDKQGWSAAYLVLGALVLLFGIPLTALFVRENVPASQPVWRDRRLTGLSFLRAFGRERFGL